MNDCFWRAIGSCDGECFAFCTKYISLNEEKGIALSNAWQADVEQALVPIRKQFEKDYDYE